MHRNTNQRRLFLQRVFEVVMKQYTTPDQTAKLIELGFEKPCSIASVEPVYGMGGICVAKAYSIGELMEMLPGNASKRIRFVSTKRAWIIDVDVLGKQGGCHRGAYYKELIDALYDMIVELKEEGVI